MMGDDHSRIAAASKLAAMQIGCKVFKGSPYYRKEGVFSFKPMRVLICSLEHVCPQLTSILLGRLHCILSVLPLFPKKIIIGLCALTQDHYGGAYTVSRGTWCSLFNVPQSWQILLTTGRIEARASHQWQHTKWQCMALFSSEAVLDLQGIYRITSTSRATTTGAAERCRC